MHEHEARDPDRQAWTHKRGANLARPLRPLAFELQPLDATDQELGEHANLGGLMAPALIGEVDREARQLPVVENRNEASGDDVVVDDVERLNDDALAPRAPLRR